MKTILKALILLLPFSSMHAQSDLPNDQLLVIFGSSGYVLYKVLDFANDHGFRYIKILSYEFNGFDHAISGHCHSKPNGGRFFEIKDDNASISFLCFEEKPNDPFIIDLVKYHSLLDEVADVY